MMSVNIKCLAVSDSAAFGIVVFVAKAIVSMFRRIAEV